MGGGEGKSGQGTRDSGWEEWTAGGEGKNERGGGGEGRGRLREGIEGGGAGREGGVENNTDEEFEACFVFPSL